jgi:pimeloyl-ACP methyl ester carboxylesterase
MLMLALLLSPGPTGSYVARSDLPACVFVADGAGNFRACSKALRRAVDDEHLPIDIEPVPWSHGYCRILSDQMDHANALAQGHHLAEHVCALHALCPRVPIYLVGHSAGCAVILTAAEALPPRTVQRIILLAPSVPAGYDLRPALHTVRQEIDVFCSGQDYWYLRIGMLLTNILRPGQRVAAGHCGFLPVLETPDDAALYAKLTQYPWEPCLTWTGHGGGHFGCYQQKFLRTFVLPLLSPSQHPW